MAEPKCKKCRDTGVWETGNNDLPCDCPAGDTALFNDVDFPGPVAGAVLKARDKSRRGLGINRVLRGFVGNDATLGGMVNWLMDGPEKDA